MGSKEIWRLRKPNGYAFIGVCGKSDSCIEMRAKTDDD